MNEDFAMLDLFERTFDLVCIVDKAGWFKKINQAVIKTLGYSEEELFAMPVSVLIHPEDQEITASKRNHLLNNTPLLNFQNRYIAKNGSIVWLEWTSVYIAEKEIVFAIAKNITKRKQVEIEIEQNYKKYKTLTTHFKDHVEKDRQFFATELHEELAQIATVLKMDFEWVFLQRHLLDELTRKRVEHGLLSTHLLIDKIRKLSYSVNPASIRELGLDDVLQSLCEEFSSHAGLSCSYKSAFNEQALDYEVKLDLLRICQEALLNVMQHAQATAVKIKLEERMNRIELSITDNGKGFNHESRQSFGLRNIEGRTASINGELSIKSSRSKGTRIRVSVETKK
jgi:PAS domain S-box-containing protein